MKFACNTVILATLVLAGCDSPGDDGNEDASLPADANSDASVDASPAQYAVNIIADECAPDDGPAVRLLLADTIDENCRITDNSVALEISIWRQPLSAPATITFSATEQEGFGRFCPTGGNDCETAESGSVQLDMYNHGVGAAGSWQLTVSGSSLYGDFDATWCTPVQPILCG